MTKVARVRAQLRARNERDKASRERIGELAVESLSAGVAGGLLSGVEFWGIPGFFNWALGGMSIIADIVPQKRGSLLHKVGGVGRGALYAQIGVTAANRLGGNPFSAWASLTGGESDA